MSNCNIQALVQASSGKRLLPDIGGGVTGHHNTPLRRGGTKNDESHLCDKEKNGIVGEYEWAQLPPLRADSWIDPTSILLTHTEFHPIDSPPLDLGLHFSSIDQWVLSDLDVGLDHLADADSSGCHARNHLPWAVPAETERCMNKSGSTSSATESRKRRKRKHTESPLDGSNLLVDDIRAIFAAVRGNYRPPPRLKFQIILGTKGQKISPPSFEFGGET